MGALDDLAKQAQGFVEQNKDKSQEALQSEQAENVSDTVLDAIAGKVDQITGGAHSDAIQNARETADKHVGNE